jgi:hypothetical protein
MKHLDVDEMGSVEISVVGQTLDEARRGRAGD